MSATSTKKRYAFVGTGGRVVMFLHSLASTYGERNEPVAFCDPSLTRMQHHIDLLRDECGYEAKVNFYGVDEFEKMLAVERPDTLVVCSVDATHADYIARGLQAGCNVIVEKPIAVTTDQCRIIRDAAQASKNSVRVAFNCRWAPGVNFVKEVITSGEIGTVQHVQMEYMLNLDHGADYFRRWHSLMANSGGLLVHKATHHFDLVNWWLDAIPETVFAQGKLRFYGKESAIRRGDERFTRYDRYTGNDTGDDPFAIDLTKTGTILYYQAEKDSGYIRDKNVFRDEIDIYDTMSVCAGYRTGAMLTYSLVAYAPYEGYRVTFTGDRGRIEYQETHGSHLIMGQTDTALDAEQSKLAKDVTPYTLRVYPHFGKGREIAIEKRSGGHGGADPLLQEQMFSANPPADPLHRNAGWEQGIASAMLGISANRSIEIGLPVRIADLLEIRPEATKLSELV
jgi:predicted dehydrogenase